DDRLRSASGAVGRRRKGLGSAVGVPLLYVIDAHARILVALPLLIVAELVVHRRRREVVGQFVSLGLVRDAVRERFDAAIISAMRLRDSVFAELLLIAGGLRRGHSRRLAPLRGA